MEEKYKGKKFRLTITGSNAGIVEGAHLKAIKRIPEIEIVGMMDVNAEQGKARAAENHCPFFTDHKKMLLETRPDIDVVATPHPFHPAQVIESLQAGAHVLTEKPMGIQVAEADAMIEAADKAKKLLAVNFQSRFFPFVENARALISSGFTGPLLRMLCVEPHYRPAVYFQMSPWRGSWTGEGGAVLLNQSPHTMDVMCHLAGFPKKVTGKVQRRIQKIDCEDTAQALLEFENGAPGFFSTSTVELGLERQIQVVGDKGGIQIRGNKLQTYKFVPSLSEHRKTADEPFSSPEMEMENPQSPDPDPIAHYPVYQDLLNAIVENRQPRCNGREGRMSLELANAIVLSSFLGETVTLPLDRQAYSKLLKELQTGKKKL